MKSQAKERIYLLIMVFCVLMCGLLLYSVFAEEPILVSTRQIHTPVLRVTTMDGQTVVQQQVSRITEEEIQRQIASVLPQSFGEEHLQISIQEDGLLTLEVSAAKAELKQFLGDLGVDLSLKENLLLGMLPRQLQLRAAFLCSIQENGLLVLQPESFSINGKAMETTAVPQAILALLNAGVNTVLQSGGIDYSGLTFTDGAILLQ